MAIISSLIEEALKFKARWFDGFDQHYLSRAAVEGKHIFSFAKLESVPYYLYKSERGPHSRGSHCEISSST